MALPHYGISSGPCPKSALSDTEKTVLIKAVKGHQSLQPISFLIIIQS